MSHAGLCKQLFWVREEFCGQPALTQGERQQRRHLPEQSLTGTPALGVDQPERYMMTGSKTTPQPLVLAERLLHALRKVHRSRLFGWDMTFCDDLLRRRPTFLTPKQRDNVERILSAHGVAIPHPDLPAKPRGKSASRTGRRRRRRQDRAVYARAAATTASLEKRLDFLLHETE